MSCSLSLSLFREERGLGAYFFLIPIQLHPAWTLYSDGRVIAIPFSDQRTPVNTMFSYQSDIFTYTLVPRYTAQCSRMFITAYNHQKQRKLSSLLGTCVATRSADSTELNWGTSSDNLVETRLQQEQIIVVRIRRKAVCLYGFRVCQLHTVPVPRDALLRVLAACTYRQLLVESTMKIYISCNFATFFPSSLVAINGKIKVGWRDYFISFQFEQNLSSFCSMQNSVSRKRRWRKG